MGGAKESTEARAARPEVRLRRHPNVNLHARRKQEHAIDRRARRQVPKLESAKLALKNLRPLIEHGLKADAFNDAKEDINIGPFVLLTHRRRASKRPRHHPRVAPRQMQNAITHVIAFLLSKHMRRL